MSKQTINIGASPNDGTGTPLRTSFDYTNQNFTEIYTALGGGVALPGATTQVIFNDGGTNLAGDAGLVYNKTTDALTVAGLVTAGSATITGDLTVDTSTLKVVAASDVVGINTASPLTGNDAGLTIGAIGTVKALNIGLQNTFARFREKDAVDGFAISTNITGANVQDDATKSSWKVRMGFANGNDNYVISRSNVGSTTFQDIYSLSTTSAVWSDGAGGTRMTLNSTGLGIGQSPTVALDVYRAEVSSAAGTTAIITNTTGGGNRIASLRLQNLSNQWNIRAYGSGDTFRIGTGATGSEVDYLTLDASGNLLVGVTSASNQERLNVSSAVSLYVARVFNTASSGGNYGIAIRYSNAAPNNGSNEFLACSDSAASRAFIYSNGGIANYQANDSNLSDARTKTDIKPLTSYWNKIKALELVTFKYKDQTHDDDNIGLISQQVESVAPEFVSNDGFGETPADGVPLKSIYTTDLYHAAIKALQEAMTRIEVLESKLA
jgi:hypothetical protein